MKYIVHIFSYIFQYFFNKLLDKNYHNVDFFEYVNFFFFSFYKLFSNNMKYKKIYIKIFYIYLYKYSSTLILPSIITSTTAKEKITCSYENEFWFITLYASLISYNQTNIPYESVISLDEAWQWLVNFQKQLLFISFPTSSTTSTYSLSITISQSLNTLFIFLTRAGYTLLVHYQQDFVLLLDKIFEKINQIKSIDKTSKEYEKLAELIKEKKFKPIYYNDQDPTTVEYTLLTW